GADGRFALARTISAHPVGVTSVAFCPADYPAGEEPPASAPVDKAACRRLVTAGSDGALKLWDLGNGELLRTFVGHRAAVDGVTFSPDGRLILSASWDRTLKLWDVDADHELRTFSGHTSWVHSVAFCGDDRHALSASED